MSLTNTTASSLFSKIFDTCKSSEDLQDLSKVTSTSLAASQAAIIVTALTCPVGAFVNCLALLAFYKNPSLRKRSNIFVIAIGVADLIRGLLYFPSFVARQVTYQKRHQENCFLTIFIFITSQLLTSELLLAAINCERFIGVKYPLWHRAHVTKSYLVKICVACYIVGNGFTLARSFTGKAVIPLVILFVCSSIITLTCAVLIWWTIKKRNTKPISDQSIHQKDQPHTAKGCSNTCERSEMSLDMFREEKEAPCPNARVVNNTLSFISIQEGSSIEHDEDHPPQTGFQEGKDNHENAVKDVKRISISKTSSVKNADQLQEQAIPRLDEVQKSHQHGQNSSHLITQLASKNHRYAKSERKAAKMATYLALGFLFTRILPQVSFFVVLNVSKENTFLTFTSVAPLRLVIPLVNSAIFIGMNQDIRQACFKLLKC